MGVESRGKLPRDNETQIIRDVLAAQDRGSEHPDTTRKSGAQQYEQDMIANFGDHPYPRAKPLNPDPLNPKP